MNEFLTAIGACGQDGFLNVGSTNCEISNMGDLSGGALVRKGYKFKQSDFTFEGWTSLLKNNVIFPFRGINGFEQNTPESETNTSSTGVMTLIRDGKPQFAFILTQGLCRHKQFWDKKRGEWDLILFFDSGMMIANAMDGEHAVALDASYYNVETYRFISGTDPEQTRINMQLRSAEQFNAQSYFLLWDKLGFNANNMNAPVETQLTVTAKAGTEVKVKVATFCNSNETVTELEEKTNWLFNGVEPTAVSYDITNDEYILTVATTTPADKYVVQLDGEDALGGMYKGKASGVVASA